MSSGNDTDTVQLLESGTVAPVQVSLPMMKIVRWGWPQRHRSSPSPSAGTLVRLKLTGLVTGGMKGVAEGGADGPKVEPALAHAGEGARVGGGVVVHRERHGGRPRAGAGCLNWMVIVQEVSGASAGQAMQLLPTTVSHPRSLP